MGRELWVMLFCLQPLVSWAQSGPTTPIRFPSPSVNQPQQPVVRFPVQQPTAEPPLLAQPARLAEPIPTTQTTAPQHPQPVYCDPYDRHSRDLVDWTAVRHWMFKRYAGEVEMVQKLEYPYGYTGRYYFRPWKRDWVRPPYRIDLDGYPPVPYSDEELHPPLNFPPPPLDAPFGELESHRPHPAPPAANNATKNAR